MYRIKFYEYLVFVQEKCRGYKTSAFMLSVGKQFTKMINRFFSFYDCLLNAI